MVCHDLCVALERLANAASTKNIVFRRTEDGCRAKIIINASYRVEYIIKVGVDAIKVVQITIKPSGVEKRVWKAVGNVATADNVFSAILRAVEHYLVASNDISAFMALEREWIKTRKGKVMPVALLPIGNYLVPVAALSPNGERVVPLPLPRTYTYIPIRA